jgi:hypothetical protein
MMTPPAGRQAQSERGGSDAYDGPAPVARLQVAVVALLTWVEQAVAAALRLTASSAAVAGQGVGVVAGFSSVEDPVAAALWGAGRAAAVRG